MEQHPVPKNILDVEFKLFGSLTVRQFAKIVVGCAVGLFIFILQINPLISFPLIGASVAAGILSALIKDFEVRLFGIIKSIFVSPQYVWRKTISPPEVLLEEQPVSAEKEKKSSSGKILKQGGEQSMESTIERFLSSRSQDQVAAEPLPEPGQPQRGNNLERIYADLYKDELEHPQPASTTEQMVSPVTQGQVGLAGPIAPAGGEVIQVGPNQRVVMKSVRNQNTRVFSKEAANQLKSEATASTQDNSLTDEQIAQLKLELAQLQSEMVSLNKGGDKAKAAEVMNRINTIYASLRPYLLPSQTAVTEEPSALNPAQAIFGVVVDKADQPVPGATVNILDLKLKPIVPSATSGEDGKFAIAIPSNLGDYVADVRHPDHKFNQFKIKIDGSKLPGFKFRAR